MDREVENASYWLRDYFLNVKEISLGEYYGEKSISEADEGLKNLDILIKHIAALKRML